MKTTRYTLAEAAAAATRLNIKTRTSGDTTVYYLPHTALRVVDRGHRNQIVPAALGLYLHKMENPAEPPSVLVPRQVSSPKPPKPVLTPLDHARRLTELAGHETYETDEKWYFKDRDGYICYTRKIHLPHLSEAVQRFLHERVIPYLATGHNVDPRPHLTQPLLDATSHSIISSVAMTTGAVAAPSSVAPAPITRVTRLLLAIRGNRA